MGANVYNCSYNKQANKLIVLKISQIKKYRVFCYVITKMYYFSGIKQQNNMKALTAFAAAFLAMAAADQDQIITALVMMCVSVYFFLKTLEKNEHRGL
jgi:hypothetical protein